MTRIHADTAGIAYRRMAADPSSHPFLDVDRSLLGNADLGSVLTAAAIDDALAGLGAATDSASRYLLGIKGVVIDRMAFGILAATDVDALVAVALAHAQGLEMGMMTVIDADKGVRHATLDYTEAYGPGPMIDLDYGLGDGAKWMAWQSIVRFEAALEMPDTILAAVQGMPLRRVVGHHVLDRFDIRVGRISGEEILTDHVHDWVDLCDLPDLHANLARDGATRTPALPFQDRAKLIDACLRDMVREADHRASSLRHAARCAGIDIRG